MDNLTKEQRHKNMQNIRSKGTTPENIVFKELKKKNVYFTSHANNIFGKPDIVFKRKKIAIFIDSDFWHYNPANFISPKSNIEYWENKIQRNVDRDKEVNKELKKQGWLVLRFWESDIKSKKDLIINKILKRVHK